MAIQLERRRPHVRLHEERAHEMTCIRQKTEPMGCERATSMPEDAGERKESRQPDNKVVDICVGSRKPPWFRSTEMRSEQSRFGRTLKAKNNTPRLSPVTAESAPDELDVGLSSSHAERSNSTQVTESRASIFLRVSITKNKVRRGCSESLQATTTRR